MGAGKSAVAVALGRRLNAPVRSFGAAVRTVAASKGLPLDRASLQNVGQSLVDNGWLPFCAMVLDGIESDLCVVDGLRHLEAKQGLLAFASVTDLVLVYVEASPATRAARIATRDGLDSPSFDEHSRHMVEREIELLRSTADLVVFNNIATPRAIESIVGEVLESLRNRLRPNSTGETHI